MLFPLSIRVELDLIPHKNVKIYNINSSDDSIIEIIRNDLTNDISIELNDVFVSDYLSYSIIFPNDYIINQIKSWN